MRVLDSYSAETTHAAPTVFSLWADPTTWPQWDSEVRAVTFHGSAIPGARGRMRPASGPSATFTVTAFEPHQVFTNASSLPGATLVFEHLVAPTPGGSTISVTVGVDGPLAFLWSRLLAKNMAHAAQSSVTGLQTYLDTTKANR